MAYAPPIGTSTNFEAGFEVFPRPHDGLNFKQSGAIYSPAAGGAISAIFPIGAEWVLPPGSDVDFISYGPPPRVRLIARAVGSWVASGQAGRTLTGAYPISARRDGARKSIWGPSKPEGISWVARWLRVGLADAGKKSNWGSFVELMNAGYEASWARSARKDTGTGITWDSYGAMRNGWSLAKWCTSIPADIAKKAAWQGHLIPYLKNVQYVPPIGTAAHFSVAGGGVDSAILGNESYSPTIGSAIAFQFGSDIYRVPFMPALPNRYARPDGAAANFRLTPSFVLVLDENGAPALEKSARDAGQLNPWGTGKRCDDTTVIIWLKFSRPMNPGWGIVTPANPDDPDPGQTIIVPVRSIYMQTNTVTLVLAETGQPIPARGLRLSIDADSWVWGWSASVPASYLPLLSGAAGDLVELLASVNDTLFRLAVVHRGRDRKFGEAWLSVSGRGRAAWLGYPYAEVASRSNSVAMTAQQLMADALTVNGVPIGWGIDWQITDWPVPAGAWNHTGTAMEACLAIADAAGAYIQAHRTDQTLSVLPRYPAAPWNWASLTPDIDLPEDACETEGIEWLDKPAYNTVFISGKEGGILAHVTRDGSAGDKAAPMIVDGLITHTYAGGQRGLAVLSDTGSQKRIALNLPVLPDTGIIVPGKLVRYTEDGTQHLGLTRAVEVNHDSPALTQIIQVESHVL